MEDLQLALNKSLEEINLKMEKTKISTSTVTVKN